MMLVDNMCHISDWSSDLQFCQSIRGDTAEKMEFEILARGLYRPEQVVITYDPVLRMPVDDAIQGWMDHLWQRKLAMAHEKGVQLFDAPLFRLVKEETGIQKGDMRGQFCLGVVYDLATPHGELCFLTELNIELAEVRRRVPEDDEVKELLALAASVEGLRDFVLSHHGNISATGEPNLLMYGAVRFGEGWFAEVAGRLCN